MSGNSSFSLPACLPKCLNACLSVLSLCLLQRVLLLVFCPSPNTHQVLAKTKVEVNVLSCAGVFQLGEPTAMGWQVLPDHQSSKGMGPIYISIFQRVAAPQPPPPPVSSPPSVPPVEE